MDGIADIINWSAFWTFVTAIATILLVVVAYSQLNGFNKTTRADFAHKLKKDFFNPETMQLIMLLNYEAIEFIKGDKLDIKEWGTPDFCPIYSIRREVLTKINTSIKLLDENKKIYTLFEVEDLVLNHIEDLSSLMDDEIIDFKEINDGFGEYIKLIMKNEQIISHINYLKGEEGDEDYEPSIYEGCNRLYRMINTENK